MKIKTILLTILFIGLTGVAIAAQTTPWLHDPAFTYPLYPNDQILIGATATTTKAKLEIHGETTVVGLLNASTTFISGNSATYSATIQNKDPDAGALNVKSDGGNNPTFKVNRTTGVGGTHSLDAYSGNAILSQDLGSTTIGNRTATQYAKLAVNGNTVVGRAYQGIALNDPDGMAIQSRLGIACGFDLLDNGSNLQVCGTSLVTGAAVFSSTFEADGAAIFGSTLTAPTITASSELDLPFISQNNVLYMGSANKVSGNANFTFDGSGKVGIGTTTPYNTLSVVGTTTAAVFEATSTATSTARNGWNIQGGCYAIASVCVTGGGGSGTGTVNSGLISQVAYYAANGTTVSGSSTLVVAQTTDFSMGVLNIGRVGVGTTSPGSMLSLGASDTGWNFTPGTSTINTVGGLNVVKGCFSQNGSCLSGSVGIGTTGQFSYYASNSDKVTATSTIFVDGMSEVGIGTTTPGWALNVAGTRPSIGLTDNLAGTNDKHIVISNNGGILYIGSSTDAFGTSTPSALSLNPKKPAGISVASTTPSAQFTVNTSNSGYSSAVYVGSSTSAASFRIDNSGNIFAPNTLSSAANQTGYWCYDANGQFIRDTTTCLISALKFKKGITPINAGLDEVLAMKPVNYYLKNPLGVNDAIQQFGFIAEDAEKVDPRLVTYDNKGEIHGFRYEQYGAVLTKAIQELNTKVEQGKNVVQEYWQNILLFLFGIYVAYNEYSKRKNG